MTSPLLPPPDAILEECECALGHATHGRRTQRKYICILVTLKVFLSLSFLTGLFRYFPALESVLKRRRVKKEHTRQHVHIKTTTHLLTTYYTCTIQYIVNFLVPSQLLRNTRQQAYITKLWEKEKSLTLTCERVEHSQRVQVAFFLLINTKSFLSTWPSFVSLSPKLILDAVDIRLLSTLLVID